MAEETAPEATKKERHRSPNYPAVGLREAVERTGKFYKEDGKAGAVPEMAAKHIGYGSAHGQAMSVLAALKKFGLVSDVSGRIVPTQPAIEILNLPESDSRRQAALQEAALTPGIYRELFDEFRGKGLPSAESLEAELKTYRGFNPKAVAGFVRDFLDTLEYAKINVSEAVEPNGDASQEGEKVHTAVGTEAGAQKPAHPPTGNSGFMSMFGTQPITRKYPLDISIPRSLKAELTISGDFKVEDLERLRTQIGRLVENLQDAFQD